MAKRRNPSLVERLEVQDGVLYDVYARRGLHGDVQGALFNDGAAVNVAGVIVKKLFGRVAITCFPAGTPTRWLSGGLQVEEIGADTPGPKRRPPTLEEMTARQLKDLAAERGIPGYGGMRKADLVEALKAE